MEHDIMKKLCFIIIDGLGDLPVAELGGKTPLEAAQKPFLDKMAEKGRTGILYPLKGMAPQSDAAIVALLGYDTSSYTGRGPLEAAGAGIQINKGDIAMRTNFATISGDNVWTATLEDRRAGRTLTTEESDELGKAINESVNLGYEFIFKPTIEHRGVLVIKGDFSNDVTNTDAAYKRIGKIGVVGKGGISPAEGDRKTAETVNSFVEQSYEILKKHNVNKKRVQKGLLPANVILTRDAGIEVPVFQDINKKTGRKWGAVVGMPLEKGIAMSAGMDVLSFEYPPITAGDIYDHLYQSLAAEITYSKIFLLKEQHDAYWLHFKETDIPGHDGDFRVKIRMIEVLDKKFFSWLIEQDYVVVVTADHSTPCILKNHSADPVPLLVYGLGKDESVAFSEKECRKGSLGEMEGKDLLAKIKDMIVSG